MKYKYIIPALVLLAIKTSGQNTQSALQLTAAEKSQTVDSLLKVIRERYVFTDVAGKMEAYLGKQKKANAYKDAKNGAELAVMLTRDLKEVSHDLHLHVTYYPDVQPVEPEHDLMKTPESEKPGLSKFLRHINYGITKVDILQGNIGYVDLNVFCSPEFAGDTYAAMMNYLAHTEALVIDLRKCRGSISPEAIPFLSSYFFNEPVHLNDWHWRKGDALQQTWSYAYVPGKKYLDKAVYILTSGATFSGAEEFAYDMQALKRATIIGQTTGGGANPGGDVRVDAHFTVFVPIGQAINPVTHSNWEGKGVIPDTIIHPALALYKARELALKFAIPRADDEPWKNGLVHWLEELPASKPVLKPVTFELTGYPHATAVAVAGSFNDWSSGIDKLERKGEKWIITTLSEPGKISYKFVVDGNWITDPANPQKEGEGDAVNSIKIVN